jgi:hypothetical protein
MDIVDDQAQRRGLGGDTGQQAEHRQADGVQRRNVGVQQAEGREQSSSEVLGHVGVDVDHREQQWLQTGEG